jgi:hypothetical protein
MGAVKKAALDRGADNAVIIPASDVIVDPRVRFKCMIPKCHISGICIHCPPHGYSTDEVKDIVFDRWDYGSRGSKEDPIGFVGEDITVIDSQSGSSKCKIILASTFFSNVEDIAVNESITNL